MNKHFLFFILTLLSSAFSFADTQIDRYESEDYAYVLKCGNEYISSARYQWQKLGYEIKSDHGAFLAAANEVTAKVKAAKFKDTSLDFDVSEVPYLVTQAMTWKDDIEFVNASLGLPATIDGCEVQPLWVLYKQGGAHKKIGLTSLRDQLPYIDLVLSFFPARWRHSSSPLSAIIGKYTQSLTQQMVSQVLALEKNFVFPVFKGYGKNCQAGPSADLPLVCENLMMLQSDMIFGSRWQQESKSQDYVTYKGAQFSFDPKGNLRKATGFFMGDTSWILDRPSGYRIKHEDHDLRSVEFGPQGQILTKFKFQTLPGEVQNQFFSYAMFYTADYVPAAFKLLGNDYSLSHFLILQGGQVVGGFANSTSPSSNYSSIKLAYNSFVFVSNNTLSAFVPSKTDTKLKCGATATSNDFKVFDMNTGAVQFTLSPKSGNTLGGLPLTVQNNTGSNIDYPIDYTVRKIISLNNNDCLVTNPARKSLQIRPHCHAQAVIVFEEPLSKNLCCSNCG